MDVVGVGGGIIITKDRALEECSLFPQQVSSLLASCKCGNFSVSDIRLHLEMRKGFSGNKRLTKEIN